MSLTTKEVKTRNKINLPTGRTGEEKKFPNKGKKMDVEEWTAKADSWMMSVKWQSRQPQTPVRSQKREQPRKTLPTNFLSTLEYSKRFAITMRMLNQEKANLKTLWYFYLPLLHPSWSQCTPVASSPSPNYGGLPPLDPEGGGEISLTNNCMSLLICEKLT